MQSFARLDYAVFFSYFVIVIGIALWVSRKPKGRARNTDDFFLAGRALPWWIIGCSLIASNISTEQIIGMNGTAFESGIAVISYSWIGAAVAILIVAKFFLPAFLKMKIYSMPEFLEKRYDRRVSTAMGVFWLLVYVFVNLTSVLSAGALAMERVLDVPILYGVLALACASAIYTIYGGLAAVAWTDFIQVGILIAGGLMVTWIGLDAVTEQGGVVSGFLTLMEKAPEKFHTVLPASHHELPWTGVFFGGLWIAAISYWGCNQYIIQRALAAKSLKEAQNGLLFAAFLSLIVSVIIVFPGIIAFDLYGGEITNRDTAFPTLIRNLMPVGCTGLIVAALVAAIVSSLNSMTNSAATIFTMDIYRHLFRPGAAEKELVRVGRVASAVALIVAVSIAPGVAKQGQIFKFIQEYSGFVFPGVLAIFIFGLFWKRVTANAALTVALLTIPLSVYYKFVLPWAGWDTGFLNRMALTFGVLCLILIVMSLLAKPESKEPSAVFTADVSLKTPATFNAGALAVLGIVAALYLYFW